MNKIIKSVRLDNFRIHNEYLLNCEKQTTLIVGENGIGKTSILEAIYILMRGKSFRAVDREILKRGADFYRVDLEYNNGEKMTAVYDGLKKTFRFKDKKSLRIPREMKYPVVLFLPEDLHLVATSPTKRRDYFDKFFAQLFENYYLSLNKYNKALKQRNELLKSEFADASALFSWNIMLAKYGTEIWNMRRKMIKEINLVFTENYRSIANIADEVRLILSDEVMDESRYLYKLEQNFERDRVVGNTSFGIHKDNYEFYFNGRLADGSASRGEVRSMILALKFIEARMMIDYLNKRPLILLDDVFSELDETRQKSLVQNFSEHQIILTSVQEVVI